MDRHDAGCENPIMVLDRWRERARVFVIISKDDSSVSHRKAFLPAR
jgi:hypothetical protein